MAVGEIPLVIVVPVGVAAAALGALVVWLKRRR